MTTNSDFLKVLGAPTEERRGLFLATANHLGVPLSNIEKDFWICWILDLLFNSRNPNKPRLLFKGGTSLSKAYSLISRFSEDIDITVFREDIIDDISLDALEKLSGKQQRKYLESIKIACQQYIQQELKIHVEKQIRESFKKIHDTEVPTIIVDESDSSLQTLLVRYHSVNKSLNDYIVPAVKIELGAKSALDPHQPVTIKPYIANVTPEMNLEVNNIITIDADRTFWDKVIILHGIRRWYDLKGELRQDGHRFSRHYYDVYQLIHSNIMPSAISNLNLAIHCSRHAQIFFNSTALDLKSAYPGTYSLVPSKKMIEVLKRDYEAMKGMIFGDIPDFNLVLESISILEEKLNKRGPS
jgi:hypothetical protein